MFTSEMHFNLITVVFFVCCLLNPLTDAASTNLALLKPAYQSSTFENKYNASLAVDGYADPDFNHLHCSHTDIQINVPHWLCVDLGSPYRIKNVILTNRKDNSIANRLDNFLVGVTNTAPDNTSDPATVYGSYPVCGQHGSPAPPAGRLVVYCNYATPPGRYVIIQQPLDGPGGLTICELEVYADGPLEDQYQGCYRSISAFNNPIRNNSSMTIEVCIGHCRERKTTFAFLQNGSNCFCGTSFNESLPNEDCQVVCANNSRQICGGVSFHSVYSVCSPGFYGVNCEKICKCLNQQPCDFITGACRNGCDANWFGDQCDKSAVGTQQIGCFNEDQTNAGANRDLSYPAVTVDSLTIEMCVTACQDKLFGYSGAQYSTGCFCGNDYGRYGVGNPCNTACKGNTSQTCGGAWANSIYSNCPSGTFANNCGLNCHCANNGVCFYANGTCVTPGCIGGWMGETCSVRDCSVANGNCPHNQTCTSVDLIFANTRICYCPRGYTFVTPMEQCLDINECLYNFGGCDITTSICTNILGDFICSCFSGLEHHNKTHCKDIDECLKRIDGCDYSSTNCSNFYGSFECVCLSGFERDNRTHCKVTVVAPTPTSDVGSTILGAVLGTVFGLIFIAAFVIVAFHVYRRRGKQSNACTSVIEKRKADSQQSITYDGQLYEDLEINSSNSFENVGNQDLEKNFPKYEKVGFSGTEENHTYAALCNRSEYSQSNASAPVRIEKTGADSQQNSGEQPYEDLKMNSRFEKNVYQDLTKKIPQ